MLRKILKIDFIIKATLQVICLIYSPFTLSLISFHFPITFPLPSPFLFCFSRFSTFSFLLFHYIYPLLKYLLFVFIFHSLPLSLPFPYPSIIVFPTLPTLSSYFLSFSLFFHPNYLYFPFPYNFIFFSPFPFSISFFYSLSLSLLLLQFLILPVSLNIIYLDILYYWT